VADVSWGCGVVVRQKSRTQYRLTTVDIVTGVANTARVVLERRSRALMRDLSAMEMMLEKMERRFSVRVVQRVRTRIAAVKVDASKLVEYVGEIHNDDARGWAWHHATQTRVDDILEEVLRLVAGAAARTLDLDAGYCDVADALVDELVKTTPVEHWGSFTIMGRSEQYARASRIIEVRAPAMSVWDLPVVAHELGHFVGPSLVREVGLRSKHPLDALFDELGDGTPESWSWMQELFADIFAAYMLGPAYGFSCCLEIFDPVLSHVATDTHPPAEQRMRAIVKTVLGAGSENALWAGKQIQQRWGELVTDAGGADGRDDVTDSPYAERLVSLINDNLPISQWGAWESATAIRSQFEDAGAPGLDTPPAIADMLNAAWLSRLRENTRAGVDALELRVFHHIKNVAKGDG
jgi:hypothetical protein